MSLNVPFEDLVKIANPSYERPAVCTLLCIVKQTNFSKPLTQLNTTQFPWRNQCSCKLIISNLSDSILTKSKPAINLCHIIKK